jgi:hypothetical protein
MSELEAGRTAAPAFGSWTQSSQRFAGAPFFITGLGCGILGNLQILTSKATHGSFRPASHRKTLLFGTEVCLNGDNEILQNEYLLTKHRQFCRGDRLNRHNTTPWEMSGVVSDEQAAAISQIATAVREMQASISDVATRVLALDQVVHETRELVVERKEGSGAGGPIMEAVLPEQLLWPKKWKYEMVATQLQRDSLLRKLREHYTRQFPRDGSARRDYVEVERTLKYIQNVLETLVSVQREQGHWGVEFLGVVELCIDTLYLLQVKYEFGLDALKVAERRLGEMDIIPDRHELIAAELRRAQHEQRLVQGGRGWSWGRGGGVRGGGRRRGGPPASPSSE